MEKYVAAKARLFRNAEYAVLPDDRIKTSAKIIKYSKTNIKDISPSLEGEYNKYNIGAAETVAKILGIDKEVPQVVRSFSGVPGRREEVNMGQKFRCIVDFAHTPNGLENLLKSFGGRKILIFGCTGERDKEKRPIMGEVADRLADIVIVTTDDVRSESQDEIYKQILAGMKKVPIREDDRDKAIAIGVKMAGPGDVVIAAGMGHEQTQLIGTTEIQRSDRSAFEKALRNKV